MDFFLVCLSGGPCGGKSSVQTILADVLQSHGYRVYKTPEAATTLFNCGVQFMDLSEEQQYDFQKQIISFMKSLEEPFIELCKSNARNGIKSALITDRGMMDASAYISREQWLKMISELGLAEVDIRDCRYDVVIHMVSAAEGAEQFYNLETNTVRTETPALARELDRKIREAWVGHPYLNVIDNSTGFDEKCNRVVKAVLKRIGLKDRRYGDGIQKRKFLVDPSYCLESTFPVNYRDFDVEHMYLTSESDQYRIRKRWDENGTFYSLTIRKMVHGERIEERRVLGAREYDNLAKQRDLNHGIIRKTRRCFLHDAHYFQLDYFHTPSKGLLLLEAYLDNQHTAMPDFLPILREVTDDTAYSMYTVSCEQDY